MSRYSRLKGVFFLFFFMLSLSVAGQDIVVLNSGEKIYGKGFSPFDYNSYKQFKFTDTEGVIHNFRPEDLRRFQLENGRTFVTHVFKEEEGPVFGQLIFSGKVSLYRYAGFYYLHHNNKTSILKKGKQKKVVNGKMMVLYQKPYVNVLLDVLAGQCGDRLYTDINKIDLKEEELIKLLKEYHTCEGGSYQVPVEDIPLFKISPIVSAGFTSPVLTSYRTSENRRDIFETNHFPFFQAGVRFYDARKAPRLLFDLSVGYLIDNNVIRTEYIHHNMKILGIDRYSSFSFYIPVSANYILYRTSIGEIYGGGGVTLWFNRVESEYAMIEFTHFSDITLHANPYYSKRNYPCSINAKLGVNLFAGKKYRIFAESKIDWFKDYYYLSLLQNVSQYNQISPSLTLGLQFIK